MFFKRKKPLAGLPEDPDTGPVEDLAPTEGEALDATLCLATDDPDEPTVEITISGDQDGNPALGTDAPDFTLRDLEGRNHTLSHAIGRPVFIAFFATW